MPIDKVVYEKLKEVAREQTVIPYSQLNIVCRLKLDLSKIKDRNELARILGEISEFEVLHGRPMLSAVVVLKDQRPITPAYGFFTYADELGVRKKGESDTALFARQLQECFTKWK